MARVDTWKRLLLKHGFTSNKELALMSQEEREERLKKKDPNGATYKKYLDEVQLDRVETALGVYTETPYPISESYYRHVHEAVNRSMEEGYFWTLEHLRQDRSFYEIIKVTDTYASSEASAMWGNQQQRISAQQNQAQGLLANIGKFVKELFQMVRELRILDERLDAYENWRESKSADITLKSIFTDQVEQGTKNPQSVFGLAQTVDFTILPDLFFNTHVYDVEELDKTIDSMTYNTSVKNVLRRKLYQYITWKERTHQELLNRRRFNISYLKQHWGIIKTYMNWAQPYLRNIQRLHMNPHVDTDPELITSFDTNISEVEILAKKPAQKGVHPVLVITFTFRSRPEMAVRREYQQGPSHSGRFQMDFRSYAWTEQEIQNYLKMKEEETIELIGLLDASLQETMNALREDFEAYLQEKVEDDPEYDAEPGEKKKKQTSSSSSALEPFSAAFGGLIEIGSLFTPNFTSKKKGPYKEPDRKSAAGEAKLQLFLMWHIYKKAHRMISW
ncbi:MAG: hypothetical protein ACMXYD_02900 [Candidatus Woesearchaeota archaeon]